MFYFFMQKHFHLNCEPGLRNGIVQNRLMVRQFLDAMLFKEKILPPAILIYSFGLDDE